jgi:hypothetical protein
MDENGVERHGRMAVFDKELSLRSRPSQRAASSLNYRPFERPIVPYTKAGVVAGPGDSFNAVDSELLSREGHRPILRLGQIGIEGDAEYSVGTISGRNSLDSTPCTIKDLEPDLLVELNA